jgi:hypothetical protein
MTTVRNILDPILSAYFSASRRKPWSIGYHEYKKKRIAYLLKNSAFNEDILIEGYGCRLDERIIEYPWLFSRLPDGSGRLLDAGSVLNFDYILSHRNLKEKKVFISTLAPEPHCFWRKGVSYVFEDLRDTCYRDDYFDWVVSLSTLEHIGLDNTVYYTDDGSKRESLPEAYLGAIREYRRILKSGGTLYMTFPFGLHKNHGWFQVFDGVMIDRIFEEFLPSYKYESYYKYEKDCWKASSREECGGAVCRDATIEKTYRKGDPAFSGAVACLELVK